MKSYRGLTMIACAWVLWEELTITGTKPAHFWSINGATTQETACKKDMEGTIVARLAVTKRSSIVGEVVERSGNIVSAKTKEDEYRYRYLCLPDTVDPRK